MISTVKDRKETFALCEVFHELSAATSRLERERVQTVYIMRKANEKERVNSNNFLFSHTKFFENFID